MGQQDKQFGNDPNQTGHSQSAPGQGQQQSQKDMSQGQQTGDKDWRPDDEKMNKGQSQKQQEPGNAGNQF